MEDEVCLYCDDHTEADYSGLVQRFGAPEDVAKDFVSELSGSAITRYTALKGNLLYFVAAIVILLVVGIGVYSYHTQQTLLDGNYVESVTYEGDSIPYITGPTYSAEYDSGE